MAYVIKTVSTKPSAEVWYSQSGGSAVTTLSNIVAWDKASPGYLDTTGHSITADMFENFIIFDTQINGDAWLAAKVTQPDWVIHTAYYSAHGIISVETIYP